MLIFDKGNIKYVDEKNNINIPDAPEENQNHTIKTKKRKPHKRGENRTLTETQYKNKKKEQRQKTNNTYYLKNIEKIRTSNLHKYYGKTKSETPKKAGRPRKYLIHEITEKGKDPGTTDKKEP